METKEESVEHLKLKLTNLQEGISKKLQLLNSLEVDDKTRKKISNLLYEATKELQLPIK